MTSDDLKAQANAEFQSGSFLKAAAAYTKAIKVDPQNAVLYSNRSAALLKLSKLTKAMDDAAMCIQLRPEWEKGYFRKAAVLEAEDKNGEALAVYQHALGMCPDNKDLSVRVAALQRRLNGGKGFLNNAKKAPGAGSQAAAAAAAATPAETAPAATAAAAEPSGSASAPGGQTGPKYVPTQGHVPEDLGSPEVAAFVQEYLEHLTAEVQAGDALVPMLHVLPSADGGTAADDPACHVRAAAAFESPDTVASFVDYARGVAASLHAAAALSVVPKSAVAFPQSWRSSGWPCGDGDGVLVQLEAAATGGAGQKLLKLWFVPVDVAARTVAAPWSGLDPTTFAVLPSLLR